MKLEEDIQKQPHTYTSVEETVKFLSWEIKPALQRRRMPHRFIRLKSIQIIIMRSSEHMEQIQSNICNHLRPSSHLITPSSSICPPPESPFWLISSRTT